VTFILLFVVHADLKRPDVASLIWLGLRQSGRGKNETKQYRWEGETHLLMVPPASGLSAKQRAYDEWAYGLEEQAG
jgi:hypothetical protein